MWQMWPEHLGSTLRWVTVVLEALKGAPAQDQLRGFNIVVADFEYML